MRQTTESVVEETRPKERSKVRWLDEIKVNLEECSAQEEDT